MSRFRNFADAARAGYHPAKAGTLQHHRGQGRLRLVDVSPPASSGQAYAVAACWRSADGSGDLTELWRSEPVTVEVWSRLDRNKLGRPGAFSICLEPEQFGRAMRLGRETIDAHAAAVDAHWLLVVDLENSAQEWWAAYRAAGEFCGPFDEPTRVSPQEYARLTALPGWRGGPEYAPKPLVEVTK